MRSLVCYGDEAGLFMVGSRVCLCLLCFVSRGDAEALLLRVKRLVGWRGGELKYRKLRRRLEESELEQLVELILSRAAYHVCVDALATDVSEARLVLLWRGLEGLRRLVQEGARITVVLDEPPLLDREVGRVKRLVYGGDAWRVVVRFRPSCEAGIQLADIVVGHYCRGGLGWWPHEEDSHAGL